MREAVGLRIRLGGGGIAAEEGEKAAALEGIRRDGVHAVGHGDEPQVRRVREGAGADGGRTGGEEDVIRGGAGEGGISDGTEGHRKRQGLHRLDRQMIGKDLSADGADITRSMAGFA